MPEATFSENYLHKIIFDKAAAYLFRICQNHPFIDGNKRAGLASALVFLDLNQVEINDQKDELYGLVMRVATGESKKQKLLQFWRGCHSCNQSISVLNDCFEQQVQDEQSYVTFFLQPFLSKK